VPYSPLGRGFLTGAIDEHTTFDSADNRNELAEIDSVTSEVPTLGDRYPAELEQKANR
jgi:aryl-alcohol dehydrogenase-like predicted oxidoreductase